MGKYGGGLYVAFAVSYFSDPPNQRGIGGLDGGFTSRLFLQFFIRRF